MFEFAKEKLDDDFLKDINFLNEITQTFSKGQFKNVQEINLENLRDYLLCILEAFGQEKISVRKMSEIGEALRTYIFRRYEDEYPDTLYPYFQEDNSKFVALNILDYIYGTIEDFTMFPEDSTFFIEMLEEPADKAKETNEKIYAYTAQFDDIKRFHEAKERGLFDKW